MKAEQRIGVEVLEGRRMLTAVVGLLAGNEVVVFDSAAPEQIVARRTIGMPRGETLVGIDFSAREFGLYGMTSSRHFYKVDLETGAATLARSESTTQRHPRTRRSQRRLPSSWSNSSNGCSS